MTGSSASTRRVLHSAMLEEGLGFVALELRGPGCDTCTALDGSVHEGRGNDPSVGGAGCSNLRTFWSQQRQRGVEHEGVRRLRCSRQVVVVFGLKEAPVLCLLMDVRGRKHLRRRGATWSQRATKQESKLPGKP